MSVDWSVDWRLANKFHDNHDVIESATDSSSVRDQVQKIRAMIPPRFVPTELKPAPGVELCGVCHKHITSGRMHNKSWCSCRDNEGEKLGVVFTDRAPNQDRDQGDQGPVQMSHPSSTQRLDPEVLLACAQAHHALADEYEASGLAAKAGELRRASVLVAQLATGVSWTTVWPKLGDPTLITDATKAFWFGCWDAAGHYLHGRGGRHVYEDDAPACAKHDAYLDGGYAPRKKSDGSITCVMSAPEDKRRELDNRTSECPQGQFLVHRTQGYTIMAFWDRTHGDERGACNSCYIVEGTPSVEDLLAWFPKHFPLQAKHLADAGVKLVPVRAG